MAHGVCETSRTVCVANYATEWMTDGLHEDVFKLAWILRTYW